MSVQVVRYSLAIHMIEEKIEHEIVDISVVTSNKKSDLSRAGCGCVVAPNFFSSSENEILY